MRQADATRLAKSLASQYPSESQDILAIAQYAESDEQREWLLLSEASRYRWQEHATELAYAILTALFRGLF